MKGTSSGRRFENRVAGPISGKGFKRQPYKTWQKNGRRGKGRLLLLNAPYVDAFGQNARTEFLLASVADCALIRIECKWQSVRGTVDQKLHFLAGSLENGMPEREIVVIVDGGGARDCAIAYLKSVAAAISAKGQKTVLILNYLEFLEWLDRRFPTMSQGNGAGQGAGASQGNGAPQGGAP